MSAKKCTTLRQENRIPFVEGEIYGVRAGVWFRLSDADAQVEYEDGLDHELDRSTLIIPTDAGDYFLVWSWAQDGVEVMRNVYRRAATLDDARHALRIELCFQDGWTYDRAERDVQAAVDLGAAVGVVAAAYTVDEAEQKSQALL